MKKTIEIDYTDGENEDREDVKGSVTLKRLTFGQKNQLEEDSSSISMFGDTPKVAMSPTKLKALSISRSIVDSTLVHTTYAKDASGNIVAFNHAIKAEEMDINNLPPAVGEQIFKLYTQLHTVTDRKKELPSSSTPAAG